MKTIMNMRTRVLFSATLIVLFIVMLLACSSNPGNRLTSSEKLELYRINVGGKYGFIDKKGNIIIEPQYDIANFFFCDSLCFAKNGELVGFININGEFVTELNTEISWVYAFHNGLARCVASDDKMGVIDKKGTFILPTIYKDIERDEGFGLIIEDTLGKKGYVNCKGEFIIPCEYDEVYGFSDGLTVVAIDNKYGYMDTLGVWEIDTIFSDARSFKNGFARVEKDEKRFFINHSGNFVDKLSYDNLLSDFSENKAFVIEGDAILLIDKNGNTINEVKADSVFPYREGFAKFKQNGKYGMLDSIGNIFASAKFDKLSDFNEGFAGFETNSKHGIIDNKGFEIVKAEHNYGTGKFKKLSLLFGQDTIRGDYPITYYDNQGNIIWKDMPGNRFIWPKVPTKEDYIAYFDSKLAELDPIEGIYYVTFNDIAVDRDNDHASSNGSRSRFYAVIRDVNNTNEFHAYVIDKDKPYHRWVKKFVQIGESNAYAIVNRAEESTWAEDGKLVLEDPYNFEVTLRTGGNNYYNWYVQCDFTKDYPSTSEYEQVQKAEWTGSGFAISNGYVVTNYHVTNGAKTINIKGVNGEMDERYKGYVVASDKQHDIAIIRIVDKDFKGFADIPYCIGKTVPEVGNDVFALGYPMTNTMGEDVKLTNGIISSTSGFKGDVSMYQISVPVQPGNSGGPLFDNEGNVIGIVCAKHADAENANYAIKVSYLYSLINSSDIGIKIADKNKVSSKSLSQKVKEVKPFVYLIECNSH